MAAYSTLSAVTHAAAPVRHPSAHQLAELHAQSGGLYDWRHIHIPPRALDGDEHCVHCVRAILAAIAAPDAPPDTDSAALEVLAVAAAANDESGAQHAIVDSISSVDCSQCSDDTLVRIANALPALRAACFFSDDLSAASIATLSELPHLTALSLSRNRLLTPHPCSGFAAAICSCRNVTILNIAGLTLTPSGLGAFGALHGLRHLFAPYLCIVEESSGPPCTGARSASHRGDTARLAASARYLHDIAEPLDARGITELVRGAPHISTLDLSGASLSAGVFSALSAATALVALKLEMAHVGTAHPSDVAANTALAQLASLTSIDVSYIGAGDAFFTTALAGLPRLTHLIAHGACIADLGARAIGRHTSLRFVDLTHPSGSSFLSGHGCEELVRSSSIKELHVHNRIKLVPPCRNFVLERVNNEWPSYRFRSRYAIPHVRTILVMRAHALSSRATPIGSRLSSFAWLVAAAPLWVVVRVCALFAFTHASIDWSQYI